MMTAQRQTIYWLLAGAAFVFAVFLLRGILLPFVLGMAAAYFLDPAADWLERRRLSRTLAATALTVAFLVVVALFFVLLVPLLQSQLIGFAGRIPAYVEMLRLVAGDAFAMIQANLPESAIARLREAAGGLASATVSWLGDVVSGIWSGGLALVNLLSLVVITPIVTFYLLRDWDRIVATVDGWLPRDHAGTIRGQVKLVDETLAGFVRGQGLVCLGLGTFYAVALSIAGLEFAVVIGLGTGLISFVPYFGMLVGLCASVGLAIAQFDTWQPIAIVAGIFVVGQIVEGNFVTPKLVGDRVGLHPVWMIFALLAGGALFGFLGVLLAVPAAATIGVLARFLVSRYTASRLFLGAGGEPDGE